MSKKNPTQETPQSKGTEMNKPESFDAFSDTVPERETIHEKLNFGAKHEQCCYTVEFLDASPRKFEFQSAITGGDDTAFSISLVVMDAKAIGPVSPAFQEVLNACIGEVRSLTMNSDVKNSLVASFTKFYKDHAKDVSGQKAKIKTREYVHKQFGKTKGYDVMQVVERDDELRKAGSEDPKNSGGVSAADVPFA